MVKWTLVYDLGKLTRLLRFWSISTSVSICIAVWYGSCSVIEQNVL